MESLTPEHWTIVQKPLYFALALIFQLGIRTLLCLSIALEKRVLDKKGFWISFGIYYLGFPNPKIPRDRGDHLTALALGFIEECTYPVIMATGAWTIIGAWLGFKTIAQMWSWTKYRAIFNRYLIGNALVVITAMYLESFVKVSPSFWIS